MTHITTVLPDPTSPTRRPVRRAERLSDRLDREWALLNRRPGVLATVRSWQLVGPDEPPLASLDDLLRRTGFRTPTSARADAMLCRLLDVAASEPLAARIALQRILPGLLAVVRAEQWREPEVNAFDQLVGEAWLSIVRYRTDERPTDVAARLLHDARHRAFTGPRRRKHHTVEELRPPHRLEEPPFPPEPSAFELLTAVLTEVRACGLAEPHLDVVRGVLRCDSAAAFAAELHLDQRTVRYRRARAVGQIRRILTETAA